MPRCPIHGSQERWLVLDSEWPDMIVDGELGLVGFRSASHAFNRSFREAQARAVESPTTKANRLRRAETLRRQLAELEARPKQTVGSWM